MNLNIKAEATSQSIQPESYSTLLTFWRCSVSIFLLLIPPLQGWRPEQFWAVVLFPQTPSHSLAHSHGLAEINWERANKMMRGRMEGQRRRVGGGRVKVKDKERRRERAVRVRGDEWSKDKRVERGEWGKEWNVSVIKCLTVQPFQADLVCVCVFVCEFHADWQLFLFKKKNPKNMHISTSHLWKCSFFIAVQLRHTKYVKKTESAW